jgi:hypothetical protein
LAVAALYEDYFGKSPYLAQRVNDYFLGGIDDMSTWTQISWNKTLYMLENGVEKCHLDHSILNVNCNLPSIDNKMTEKSNELKTKEPKIFTDFYENRKEFIEIERTDDIVKFKRSKIFLQKLENNHQHYSHQKEKVSEYNEKSELKSNITYSSSNEYANIGWTLIANDINNDSVPDLIIGCPVYSIENSYQNGAVFILLSKGSLSLNNINLEKEADYTIYPKDVKSSRFGQSVAVLDLNRDGIKDLVVGAPSYGLNNLTYAVRDY